MIGEDDISNDVITLGMCFSMFVYIACSQANYTSFVAMELRHSCEWQNHSLVSNKCLPSIISNFSNNKNKVWKTFGLAAC